MQREETEQLQELVKPLSSCRMVYLFSIDIAFLSLRDNDCLIKSLRFPKFALCLNLCNDKDLRFAILKSVFHSVIFDLNCHGDIFVLLLSSLCCYSHALAPLNSNTRFLIGDDCSSMAIVLAWLLPLLSCFPLCCVV